MPAGTPISLSITAARAYRNIGKIERKLRKLAGAKALNTSRLSRKQRKNQKRFTKELRSLVEKSVSYTMVDAQKRLLDATPTDTQWLISNWKLSSKEPPFSVLDTPYPRVFAQFPIPDPLKPSDVDGFRPQWLYNDVEYALKVATGDVRSKKVDWFFEIGQQFSDGTIFKTALSKAIREVNID